MCNVVFLHLKVTVIWLIIPDWLYYISYLFFFFSKEANTVGAIKGLTHNEEIVCRPTFLNVGAWEILSW